MAGSVNSQVQGGGDCCAICLESVTGEAFLDQCFHRFCYHCILQWSEMVLAASLRKKRVGPLECPLCKTNYKSIIHDVVSGTKFQRDSLLAPEESQFRLSDAHRKRLAVYVSLSSIPSLVNTCAETEPPQSRDESRYSHPHLDGVLDTRTVSRVVKANKWLLCWVRRELQALMQDEDVDIVTLHVVGVVESLEKRSRGKESNSKNWCDAVAAAVRPFAFEDAEIFAVELWKFLEADIDIAFYDRESLDSAVRDESQGQGAAEIVRLELLDEDLEDG